jgi:Spy/CpxP family protein refolding chaperone
MHLIWSLDLTDEQARRIERIHEELHRKQRGLLPQLWEAQDRLRDASAADERDPAAIGKAYAQVADVQRQMIESHVQAEQQMEAVLTPEQREQVKRGYQRGGRFGCPGY